MRKPSWDLAIGRWSVRSWWPWRLRPLSLAVSAVGGAGHYDSGWSAASRRACSTIVRRTIPRSDCGQSFASTVARATAAVSPAPVNDSPAPQLRRNSRPSRRNSRRLAAGRSSWRSAGRAPPKATLGKPLPVNRKRNVVAPTPAPHRTNRAGQGSTAEASSKTRPGGCRRALRQKVRRPRRQTLVLSPRALRSRWHRVRAAVTDAISRRAGESIATRRRRSP